ncbi:MAG: DNA mismatch repair endonuclease MutL [Phycisphaeraceae bacterium]|nr:DNA mismatch repair endonuclease MutL [Phycisphaeraceae bacterium]
MATTDATIRPIRRLPALLVNQIAAGEVVERPASVVKELLDNALDAGANRITIELEQGGIELIRITDDGAGIATEQLPLALAPHATSKVSTVDDLDRIATYGFRGEALASITSVARVSLRSRTAADAGASEIRAEGDRVEPVQPAAGAVGTCVTVRNLFFNTPARRKFLRTPPTEQGHCVDIASDLAISHPAVGFTITCDGRRVLDVPAGQSPRERALAVLGKELEPELLEAHVDTFDDSRGVAMWGLVGRPALARATAKAMKIFLNGRPIRDKTLQHALREAYRGLIEPGRYPTAVLMLQMDPGAVDVNVHPQKTEVRFRDQSMVHSAVLRAVREALQRADLTPDFSRTGFGSRGWGNGSGGAGFMGAGAGVDPVPLSPAPDAAGRINRFVEYFTRQVPGRANERLSFDALRQSLGGAAAHEISPEAPFPGGSIDPSASDTASDAAQGETPQAEGQEGLIAPRPAERVLQVHNQYVVTEDEQGLVIVDQHALHERVMFEYLSARLGAEGTLESQRMLVPAVVQLSAARMARVDELRPLLERIGVGIEPIGPASVAVQSFPTFLFDKGVEPGEFLAEMLERAEAEGFAPGREETLHEILDMMACKAAIKAGDRMSQAELVELIRLRDAVDRSSNCPHGRPTSIRLSIRELDKRFGRV